MTTARRTIALCVLILIAILAGANLVVASGRFNSAYQAYDQLGLTLTRFDYVSPDDPIQTEFVISNPTDEQVTVLVVELRVQIGVHDTGGGEFREVATLRRGESYTVTVPLRINDKEYVRRAKTPLDWRVSGRVQVQLNPAIDPVWIPFVVRYLPE